MISVTLGLWFSNGGGCIHWAYGKSGVQVLERPSINLGLRRSQTHTQKCSIQPIMSHKDV